jgi:hypothetical protein
MDERQWRDGGKESAPSLAFLREVIHPDLSAFISTLFKVSASPSKLYRLTLMYKNGGGKGKPDSVILKRIAPEWSDDPYGHVREVHCYSRIVPALELPRAHLYYTGQCPDSDDFLLITEDVSDHYRFPPPTHCWTEAEMRPILRTYAHLHTRGASVVDAVRTEGWLFPRHEERVLAMAAELPGMVETLMQMGIWSSAPLFPALMERTLREIETIASMPPTLLHGDVYPPNLGLPHNLDEPHVLLVDWEMVSWGMGEMDLAYMFCQPYRSHRAIHRAAALDYYWAERARLGGQLPSPTERALRQRYADTILLLWLIPVAYRMAHTPFPPDSPVRHFWDSNFSVLGERLQELCNGC